MAPVKPSSLAAAVLLAASTVFVQPAGAATVTLGFDEATLSADNPTSTRVPFRSSWADLQWSSGWWLETYGFFNGANGNFLTTSAPVGGPNHLTNLGQPGVDPDGSGPRPPPAPNQPGAVVSIKSAIPFYVRSFYLTGALLGDGLDSSTARSVTVLGTSAATGAAPLVREVDLVAHLQAASTKDSLFFVDLTKAFGAQGAWNDAVTELTFDPNGTLGDRAIFLIDNLTVQFVPLPASIFFLGSGLGLLAAMARRRVKAHPLA